MSARYRADRDEPTCPLCAGPLDENSVAGVTGRLAAGEDLSDCAGGPVDIDICGLPLTAIVPSAGAPIIATGVDVVFLVCSKDCATAIRIAAFLDAEAEGRVTDPSSDVVDGLRRARPDMVSAPESIKRMEIFERTLQDHAPHIAERLGLGKLPAGDGRIATPEERENLEALLSQTCAWCLREIPGDEPVQGLHVWLTENPDRTKHSGFISMMIAGRAIPVQLAAPGSIASGSCDAVFILCGSDCVASLKTAISDDLRMRVAH